MCQCNGFVLHIKPFSIKLWFQKMNHLKNKTKRDVDDNEFLHLKWCNQYFAYTHKSSNTLWMSNKRFSFFSFSFCSIKNLSLERYLHKGFFAPSLPNFLFLFFDGRSFSFSLSDATSFRSTHLTFMRNA